MRLSPPALRLIKASTRGGLETTFTAPKCAVSAEASQPGLRFLLYLLRVPTLLGPLGPKCQKARPRPRDQATIITVAAAVSSRAPSQPAPRTRAPLRELADVRSRRAKQSQRQQRRAAACATSHLSADSGCSVFLLRVRRSYLSSSTLPSSSRDATRPRSPCLFARSVHRSSTVSTGRSDPVLYTM